MTSKQSPSYAALTSRNDTDTQQTFIEKFTSWFRNFLENAE